MYTWHVLATFRRIVTASSSIGVEDEGEDDDVESLICVGCAEEKDCCHCAKIIEGFSQLNSQLHSLGLMKKVAEPAFLSVIHREVNKMLVNVQLKLSFLRYSWNRYTDTRLIHTNVHVIMY